MNPLPFIDIHTHKSKPGKEILTVQNLFPDEKLPSFTGLNFYSVGLHPWYIKSKKENNKQLNLVKNAMQHDHVVFVGECGLDTKAESDFPEQIRIFEMQVMMSEEYKRPLIIHCVKAYNEVIRVCKSLNPKMPWILHGYNGNLQTTKQMMDKNIYFSFGKILFKSNAKAVESFRFLPVDKIFFETDEAEIEIGKVYEQGAKLKNINLEKLKEKVWENFERFKIIK